MLTAPRTFGFGHKIFLAHEAGPTVLPSPKNSPINGSHGGLQDQFVNNPTPPSPQALLPRQQNINPFEIVNKHTRVSTSKNVIKIILDLSRIHDDQELINILRYLNICPAFKADTIEVKTLARLTDILEKLRRHILDLQQEIKNIPALEKKLIELDAVPYKSIHYATSFYYPHVKKFIDEVKKKKAQDPSLPINLDTNLFDDGVTIINTMMIVYRRLAFHILYKHASILKSDDTRVDDFALEAVSECIPSACLNYDKSRIHDSEKGFVTFLYTVIRNHFRAECSKFVFDGLSINKNTRNLLGIALKISAISQKENNDKPSVKDIVNFLSEHPSYSHLKKKSLDKLALDIIHILNITVKSLNEPHPVTGKPHLDNIASPITFDENTILNHKAQKVWIEFLHEFSSDDSQKNMALIMALYTNSLSHALIDNYTSQNLKTANANTKDISRVDKVKNLLHLALAIKNSELNTVYAKDKDTVMMMKKICSSEDNENDKIESLRVFLKLNSDDSSEKSTSKKLNLKIMVNYLANLANGDMFFPKKTEIASLLFVSRQRVDQIWKYFIKIMCKNPKIHDKLSDSLYYKYLMAESGRETNDD